MGLDTTHNCWHGPYSVFGSWREHLAALVGIDLRAMDGFGRTVGAISWDTLAPDPLHVLLSHSDCDGEIEWRDCAPLASRLEQLLPRVSEDWRDRTRQFIDGLREAAEARENVEFH